jgi:hypothetical protein
MTIGDWATSTLAAVVLFVANISRVAHEKQRTISDGFEMRLSDMEERLLRIELMSVTESKVREILKENLDPITNSTKAIESSIVQIQIHLASLPKRKNDNEDR